MIQVYYAGQAAPRNCGLGVVQWSGRVLWQSGSSTPLRQKGAVRFACPGSRVRRRPWDRASAQPTGATERSTQPVPLGPTLRRLAVLARDDVWLFVSGTAFMCTAAGVELLIPHHMTAALFAASGKAGPHAFRSSMTKLAVATTVYALMAATRGYLFSLINRNVLHRLRTRAFHAMLLQPVGWFDAQDGAQLSARLGADCAAVARTLATTANFMLRNALQFVGAAVYLFALHRGMACAAGVFALALAGATAAYGTAMRRTQAQYQDALAVASGRAEESLFALRTLRIFSAEPAAEARYGEELRELARLSTRQAAAYSGYVVASRVSYYAVRAAALAVGGAAALTGRVTAAELISFVVYAEMSASALLMATEQYGPVMEGLGAGQRVLSYLDLPPAPQLSGGLVPSSPPAGQIEFCNVTFRYPTRPQAPALDRVSIVVPAGRTVAFVGPSGGGKSTLIALVQRLYDPEQGALKLDGVDVRQLDAAWYRSQLAVVSQEPNLLSLTVAENIALGLPGATREQVVRAAEQANARGFIEALPQGFDTPVTDRLLSGGQRQRVAIARALIRDARVLVLDEATSALDAESEAAVHRALDRAVRGGNRTVLVVAHRLSTVMSADLTVVMVAGRVAERGTHAELLRQGGVYATLVARQGLTYMAGHRDLSPHERREEPARPPAGGADALEPDADVDGGGARGALRASFDDAIR